jgi:hypothetical protein
MAANELYLKLKNSSAPSKKRAKYLDKKIRRSMAVIDELKEGVDPCSTPSSHLRNRLGCFGQDASTTRLV